MVLMDFKGFKNIEVNLWKLEVKEEVSMKKLHNSLRIFGFSVFAIQYVLSNIC